MWYGTPNVAAAENKDRKDLGYRDTENGQRYRGGMCRLAAFSFSLCISGRCLHLCTPTAVHLRALPSPPREDSAAFPRLRQVDCVVIFPACARTLRFARFTAAPRRSGIPAAQSATFNQRNGTARTHGKVL